MASLESLESLELLESVLCESTGSTGSHMWETESLLYRRLELSDVEDLFEIASIPLQ